MRFVDSTGQPFALGSKRTDAAGNHSATMTIPIEAALGPGTIQISGLTSGLHSATSFTVT